MTEAHTEARAWTGVTDGLLGMWLFLSSEIMFFGGLVGAYIVMRMGAGAWPDPTTILATPVLATNTFVLITSSVTMVLALQDAREARWTGAAGWLLATAALGATFLAIKAWDYHHLWTGGFTIATGAFGNFYYTLTGFHGLHVAGGIVCLAYLAAAARLRHLDGAVFAGRVEYIGLYWHFVDLVWIVLFAILCLS